MKKIRLVLCLVIVPFLAVACAPAASTTAPGMAVPTASPMLVSTPQVAGATAVALFPTPLPIATSRGPHLHATDPTTVDLTSGGLQLVEFFRFT